MDPWGSGGSKRTDSESVNGFNHRCTKALTLYCSSGKGPELKRFRFLKDQMNHKITTIYHILLQPQYGIWTMNPLQGCGGFYIDQLGGEIRISLWESYTYLESHIRCPMVPYVMGVALLRHHCVCLRRKQPCTQPVGRSGALMAHTELRVCGAQRTLRTTQRFQFRTHQSRVKT